jgi:3-mercaptopyruvate sulfurtransferase SseA
MRSGHLAKVLIRANWIGWSARMTGCGEVGTPARVIWSAQARVLGVKTMRLLSDGLFAWISRADRARNPNNALSDGAETS